MAARGAPGAGSAPGLETITAGSCRPYGRGISSCLQMARTVPSLISRWRGTLAILCNAGLNQILWAAPSRTKRNRASADGVPIPRVSCFRDFDYLAHGVCGKAFFRKLALALQRQFQRVRKIRFGLFDGFALRNRGRNLFHKAGIATLFGVSRPSTQRAFCVPDESSGSKRGDAAFSCRVLQAPLLFNFQLSTVNLRDGSLSYPFSNSYFLVDRCLCRRRQRRPELAGGEGVQGAEAGARRNRGVF